MARLLGIVTSFGKLRLLWPPGSNRLKRISYSGYRFPPEIIRQAIWLYLRFTLSLRDVEDLLAERGITVSPTISFKSCSRLQHLQRPTSSDFSRVRAEALAQHHIIGDGNNRHIASPCFEVCASKAGPR